MDRTMCPRCGKSFAPTRTGKVRGHYEPTARPGKTGLLRCPGGFSPAEAAAAEGHPDYQ
jgi:hypothetical protein